MGSAGATHNDNYLGSQPDCGDVIGGLGGMSKILRMILQSGVLGLGAYLVINQDRRPAGIIIASSILSAARACAGRTGDRQLEGLRGGAAELAAADQTS